MARQSGQTTFLKFVHGSDTLMHDQSHVDRKFEVLVVGENSCGKSALMKCFTGAPETMSTYGEKLVRTVKLDDRNVRMECWDLADTPRWLTLHPREAYRGADGILILYSSTDMESFDTAKSLCAEVKRVLGPNTHDKIVLVSTMCDLSSRREVGFLQAKEFADAQNLLFFEVSSEDGTNVELAFLTLVLQVLCTPAK